jgi:hypothetical protein
VEGQDHFAMLDATICQLVQATAAKIELLRVVKARFLEGRHHNALQTLQAGASNVGWRQEARAG